MVNIEKFLELASPDEGSTYPGAAILYAAMKDLEYGQKGVKESFEDFKSNWREHQKGVFLELHDEAHRKEKMLAFSGWKVYLAAIGILISFLCSVASILCSVALAVIQFASP